MRPLFSIALGLLLVACGGRDAEFEQGITLFDLPVALDDQLVFIDGEHDRAFMLDVTGNPAASAVEVELPFGAETAVRRLGDHDEALILALGRRGSATQSREHGSLTAIEADGDTRVYDLVNPFDSMEQSEDGRYVFTFRTGSSLQLLSNPNEVAIVDLDRDPDEDGAVSVRTLRSFGDVPQRVIFSPEMRIVEEDRRLAVVMSEANVTLIDLSHPDRRETTVQLSSDPSRAIMPVQVVFDPEHATLYVRGSNSDDIFVFRLGENPDDSPVEAGEAPRNDFRPSINQLGAGSAPRDMTLYDTPEGPRLLVVAEASREAVIVEGSSSKVINIPLEQRATRALLFEAEAPRDSEVAQRALLYGLDESSVTFLDLDQIEERLTRNLETVRLGQPISKVIPMLNEGVVLILHDNFGISLLDLAGRTVSPISSTAKISEALFDRSRKRLWIAPAKQPWVSFLDLATGQTNEMVLDANIRAVVPMFSAGKNGRFAVLHDSEFGYVTLLDATDPTRETAASVRGFFVDNLLGGE